MVRHWTRHLRLERDAKERARMQRSRVINAVGAAMSATVLVVVLLTKFQAGRQVRHPRDGRALRAHARHQEALQPRAGRARHRLGRRTPDAAEPRPRHRLHLEGAQAHDARTRIRPGEPTDLPRGGHRRRRPRRDPVPARRVGQARHPGAAQGPVVALPPDHQADPRLRPLDPQRQPARHRHGLPPGVRPREVVGAGAAQPERPAPQGPAALHPGRHGRQRAVAAPVVRGRRA